MDYETERSTHMDRFAIARNINRFLEKTGLKQVELARMIGVTEVTVSRWCNGTRQPSVYAVVRMAKIFGCTLNELVEGINGESKEKETQDTGLYPAGAEALPPGEGAGAEVLRISVYCAPSELWLRCSAPAGSNVRDVSAMGGPYRG
ncbi:MAG: helix-turn-helix transcriptional regulator [Lachnospiraceae bacterium]|nr:helix-turn-helix transcriptional regulator [Lachnospiraceae bacterium]